VTGFRLSDIRDAPPTAVGVVEADALWDAFRYFLERVVPVAEKAGVRLALHPDDPPIPSVRGVARIMIDVDAFDRAMSMVESDANAICLCQGNFALMTDDLPGVIRHFGRDGHIAFGHFRDVSGEPNDFVETFHDLGPHDPAAAMRAWQDISFDGLIRADHVPTLAGEENDNPGYSYLGRLHAIGYLQGLRDATGGGTAEAN
jgi:mannonate dehydratase